MVIIYLKLCISYKYNLHVMILTWGEKKNLTREKVNCKPEIRNKVQHTEKRRNIHAADHSKMQKQTVQTNMLQLDEAPLYAITTMKAYIGFFAILHKQLNKIRKSVWDLKATLLSFKRVNNCEHWKQVQCLRGLDHAQVIFQIGPLMCYSGNTITIKWPWQQENNDVFFFLDWQASAW